MPSYRVVLPQFRRSTGAGRRGGIRGLVRSDERGFSLVEVVVAIGVFAVISTFMAGLMAGGLRGVLTGKRREVATQEANRVLETARSLSYNDLGLVQTDPSIATDTAIQVQPPASGVKSYLVNGSWEPLIWATNALTHPFNPHISSVNRGSTSLTRYVYVSGVDTTGDDVADKKRVTVRVVWNNAGGTSAIQEVRAQTLVSESGADPVGPPTGASTPLTAKAIATGGSLTVSDSLLGIGVPVNINLPASTGTSRFRAISNTNCTAESAKIEAAGLVDLDGYSVSVTADDDSRTATSSSPAPQSATGVLGLPGGPLSGLLGATINSPIACEATVDPLGHEQGTASALSVLNAQRNVLGLGGLLNWLLTLASVHSQPLTQEIDHEIVGEQREVVASSTGATGLVNILKIPGVIGDGLVRIDALSYGASVRGADGTPSAAPAVTAPAINLRVYDNGNNLPNGSVCQSHSGGYCIVSVNPSAVGFTGLSIDVTHNFTQLLGLNLINLSYTTSVDILPASKSPIAGVTGPNGERRWSAEYTPVAISASLNASVLGIGLIDADVDLNLGSVRAEACAGATCS